PNAAPLFERIMASDPNAWQLGMAISFLAKHGQYPRAYALIEARAFEALEAAPDEGARQLIRSIQTTQIGDSYEEGRERWRTDPQVAARWPALAQRLWDYQVERFGEQRAYPLR
ncbi:MAG: hypothetical protein ACREUF_16305, partial [Solimonas sp.]